MKHFSVYRMSDGAFTGLQYGYSAQGHEGHEFLDIPEGHAVVEGRHDHLSRRVEIETGSVIDYQPPQPSVEHVWNDATKRWQLSAAAQAKLTAQCAARTQIAALEASQHRAQREATLGVGGARARLQGIDDQIAKLRGDL